MLHILVLLFSLASGQPAPSLNAIIDGVDRTYARMKDFSADFVQLEQNSLNRKQQGAGHLYLMRPRMARYEYKTPEEQLFVSDGKMAYFYVPADKQVRQGAVKDTMDDRIPLMFLIGRSNLRGEFTSFEQLPVRPVVAGAVVVRMVPRRKTDLSELVAEIDPQSFLIRRLVLGHHDGSRSELTFSNIQVNTGLKAGLFNFVPPAGVQVLEGIGQ